MTLAQDIRSYPAYREIRDRNEVFNGVLCRFRVPLSVAHAGRTERVAGELVSDNYFDVLGVGAAIGRTLTPDDARVPGGHPLAMISYAYWMSRFAGNPEIVGQTLVVDGVPVTIVGVGPKGFDGIELAYTPEIWIPVAMKAQMTQGWFSEAVTLQNPRTYWVQVFARLKPGLSAAAAEVSLQPAFRAMLERELREPGRRLARPQFASLTMTPSTSPGARARLACASPLVHVAPALPGLCWVR